MVAQLNYARAVAAMLVQQHNYMQDSSFTMAAAAVFSVIIADLFQAKTVEYILWTWHRGSSKTKQ